MAMRKTLSHDTKTREKIQTSQLINRLHKNAFRELDDPLTRGELKSIEILLKKTLPDLQAIDFTGQMEHSLSDEADQWLGQRQSKSSS